MGSFQAKPFHCTLLGPTHYLFQGVGKKINRDQYCSKFNLSTIAPVGEGLKFKEQTITVNKMYVENNAST